MQFVLLFKTISSDCPRNTSSAPSSWWITPIGIIADLNSTLNNASGTILPLSIMAVFINRGAESRFIIRSGRNGNKSHLPSGRADSEQIWRPSATFFCVGQGLWHGRHGVGCVEDSSANGREYHVILPRFFQLFSERPLTYVKDVLSYSMKDNPFPDFEGKTFVATTQTRILKEDGLWAENTQLNRASFRLAFGERLTNGLKNVNVYIKIC